MEEKGIICILAGKPPSDPETAEKFYKWIDEVHLDDLIKFEGIRKATSYRRVTDIAPLHPTDAKYPDFITIFEFKDKKACQDYLTSPARSAGMKDGEATWGTETGAKKVWSVLYEPTKTVVK